MQCTHGEEGGPVLWVLTTGEEGLYPKLELGTLREWLARRWGSMLRLLAALRGIAAHILTTGVR